METCMSGEWNDKMSIELAGEAIGFYGFTKSLSNVYYQNYNQGIYWLTGYIVLCKCYYASQMFCYFWFIKLFALF